MVAERAKYRKLCWHRICLGDSLFIHSFIYSFFSYCFNLHFKMFQRFSCLLSNVLLHHISFFVFCLDLDLVSEGINYCSFCALQLGLTTQMGEVCRLKEDIYVLSGFQLLKYLSREKGGGNLDWERGGWGQLNKCIYTRSILTEYFVQPYTHTCVHTSG